MSRCVYCGATKKADPTLSFHRLPTDEKTKLQWLKYIGRTVEQSQKWWTLCSKHFSKNCIDFRDQLARLRKGSVPTVFDCTKENAETENPNKRRKTFECEELQQIESSRSPLTYQSSNISIEGKDRELKNTSGESSTKILVKELVIPTRTPQEILIHDHEYAKNINILELQLEAALKKIKELTKDKRNFQRKEQRAKKKLHSMKEVVNDIQKHKLLENEFLGRYS